MEKNVKSSGTNNTNEDIKNLKKEYDVNVK